MKVNRPKVYGVKELKSKNLDLCANSVIRKLALLLSSFKFNIKEVFEQT